MTPVRIIGIGSPHGADAAGWHALRGLQQGGLAECFPAALVSLENCAAPVQLYRLVEGCRLAVIIDALRVEGVQPLSIATCVLREPRAQASVHGLGAADMLELLEAVSEHPPKVLLFAIPVGDGRSAQLAQRRVAALLPELSRRIQAAVGRFLQDQTTRSPCEPDARPGVALRPSRRPVSAGHR